MECNVLIDKETTTKEKTEMDSILIEPPVSVCISRNHGRCDNVVYSRSNVISDCPGNHMAFGIRTSSFFPYFPFLAFCIRKCALSPTIIASLRCRRTKPRYTAVLFVCNTG